MNEIIPIIKQNFSGSEQNAVNARELHGFLEVQSRFNDWIVRRIRDFDFIENQDFVTLTQNLVSGGKQIDYFLSLDMAKELSMVERTDKGKQARQYFIECEKRLHSGSLNTLPDFTDPIAAAEAFIAAHRAKQATEQQLAQIAPKAAALDLLAAAEGAQPISNIAKWLKQPRNRFFSDLHAKGWIFRQGGVWVGKADKIARGYITHTYHNITRTDGSVTVQTQALITPKGAAKLAEIFGAQS